MSRRPSFVVSNPKPGAFMVHVPASLSLLGKLERRTFRDPKSAEKFAAKLRTQYHKGIRGGVVDPSTAQSAELAERIIREAGVDATVVEAVRAYLDARAKLDPLNVTLQEVVKGYVRRHKAMGSDRTFREAAAEVVRAKEMTWSDRYLRNIEQTLKGLPDWFMRTRLPDIDEALMLRAVKAAVSTQTAIETRMRHVKALVSGKGRRKRSKGLTLLTVTQCAAMLRACKTPDERRCVAILLFAGVRPDSADGEISKLDWSAVKDGAIHVSAAVSKTGTDRIVPIRPRLARLIKGHPESGPVMPAGWPKRIQVIRKAAGMNSQTYQDATRHAFASHHLVAYGETSTQAAMGHTEGSRTLFKHYRAAVPEDAGKKYFGDHTKSASTKNTAKGPQA